MTLHELKDAFKEAYKKCIKDFKTFRAYMDRISKDTTRPRRLYEIEKECLMEVFHDYYLGYQIGLAYDQMHGRAKQ
jgi:hypothetical protein